MDFSSNSARRNSEAESQLHTEAFRQQRAALLRVLQENLAIGANTASDSLGLRAMRRLRTVSQPLGGLTPLQSQTLATVAAELGSTPMAVALAWLLQRSPNILLIPGTSSLATCATTSLPPT